MAPATSSVLPEWPICAGKDGLHELAVPLVCDSKLARIAGRLGTAEGLTPRRACRDVSDSVGRTTGDRIRRTPT